MRGVVLIATTAIWKITKRLDHVINYTTDDNKTLNEKYGNVCNYQDLHNLKEYNTSDYANEKQCFVSSLNCSVESAYEEMMITKKSFNKTGGILGFHAFQSFAEGEVTPEQAHKIGMRLAEEIWGDRFEVIISTHQNTKHIHNHFVINSVSFKDGKRYYDKRDTYARLREVSDSICEEYNLSVLAEKPCKRSKINYTNYSKNYISKDSYHSTALEDINLAIDKSKSLNDFVYNMMSLEYDVFFRYGKISIRKKGYKKNIRIERSFGSEYTIERIKERVFDNRINQKPYSQNKLKRKKGFYNLFLYYCFLLKTFKQRPIKYIPESLKEDVKKLDEISEQTKLLVSNNIETSEQFFLFAEKKDHELINLLGKREKLWYKYKTSDNKKDIKKEIDSISKNICELRRVMKLCDGIEKRCNKIDKVVKEIEIKERKDARKNEFK